MLYDNLSVNELGHLTIGGLDTVDLADRFGAPLYVLDEDQVRANCRTYVALQAKDGSRAKNLLGCKYSRVEEDESGYLRVYDAAEPEELVKYLYENEILISEIKTDKISLEEYYIDLMQDKKGGR